MQSIDKFSLIREDLQKLRKTFGSRLVRIALFGSYLEKDFDKINDIDLALFFDDLDLHAASEKLANLDLAFPVQGRALNGGYGPAVKGKSGSKGNKEYHLVALDAETPNDKFMEMNGEKLQFFGG